MVMNWPRILAAPADDFKSRARIASDPVYFRLLFVCCALACTLAVIKPILGFGLIVGVLGLGTVLYLFTAALNGKIDPIILTWVLIFPLGYYFLSFPRERSIITFDRVMPIMLLLAIGFTSRNRSRPWPSALSSTGIAWIAFLAVAAASLINAGDILTPGRLLVEGFMLPTVLGWLVIRYFQVEKNAAALHLVASLMAFYVACIGAAEIALKEDLLPLPGSAIGFAGSLVRPNGPFWSDDSFALIGLTAFLLLLFLRNLLGEYIPFSQRVVHYLGVSSSLAMALMPMFRSVVLSLMVILLIATLSTRKSSMRLAGFVVLGLTVSAVLIVSVVAPDIYQDRSNPDNIYGRLAEQAQTWRLFSSHPILGVGIGRFTEVVKEDTGYLSFYEGVRSVDSPHNTLGGILAETGLLGFIPYVIAQVTIFLAFWRLRRRSTRNAQLAWTYFLYIFLGYWINGMALQSGYSSDLNLWYIFAISILYTFSMTEDSPVHLVNMSDEVAAEFASSTLR